MSYSVSRTVIKEGTHCRPNIGNFDRFSKKELIASRMLEFLNVFQRRSKNLARLYQIYEILFDLV